MDKHRHVRLRAGQNDDGPKREGCRTDALSGSTPQRCRQGNASASEARLPAGTPSFRNTVREIPRGRRAAPAPFSARSEMGDSMAEHVEAAINHNGATRLDRLAYMSHFSSFPVFRAPKRGMPRVYSPRPWKTTLSLTNGSCAGSTLKSRWSLATRQGARTRWMMAGPSCHSMCPTHTPHKCIMY